MLKTDYSKVAKSYDLNKDRLSIDIEPIIGEILNKNRKIRILDLACGTGNYIKAQNCYYSDGIDIEWVGIDLSNEMLEKAKSKVQNIKLINCSAEDIEFPDVFFDLIVCNFAFHHFEKKHDVLKKIFSTLKNDGIFKQTNICPEFIKDWWVYKYCPQSYYEDQFRFWNKDLLVYELGKIGFKSQLKVIYEENYRAMNCVLDDYERRDVSQLAMIDDYLYYEGLEKIKNDIKLGKIENKNVFALLSIESRKII